MLSSVLRKCKYPFRSRKFSTKEVKTHSAYIFGDNTYNQCNNTNQKSINKPFKLELNNVNIKSIESGFTHSFFLTDQLTVYGLGLNEIGQLGLPLSVGKQFSRPTKIEILSNAKLISLSCGRGHTLALTEDRLVLALGGNELGQLGKGTTDKEGHPFPIVVEGLRGTKIKKIACGLDHSVALSTDGVVSEWGFGRLGQLASSDFQDLLTPTPIKNLPFIIDIDTTHDHTLAIDIDGNVWIWGLNDCNLSNAEENEDGISALKPTKLPLKEKVIKVSAGLSHDVVLTEEGNCYSWGLKPSLGAGNIDSNEPLKIDYFSENNIRIRDISCGSHHTLVLTEDNKVYSWGKGSEGQLGHGNNEAQYFPKLIEYFKDKKVTHVKASINHSIVVCEDI